MKNKNILTSLIVGIVALMLFNSCKKKEEVVATNDNTSTVVSLGDENKVLSVHELDNGVTIKGGVKKSDTIPVSNDNITFEISSEKSPAIQDVGFDININPFLI